MLTIPAPGTSANGERVGQQATKPPKPSHERYSAGGSATRAQATREATRVRRRGGEPTRAASGYRRISPSEGSRMRHHRLSGATAMVAIASLSFVAAACGGIDGSGLAGVPAAPAEGAPVALSRNADTLLVDQSLSLTAILPANAGAA